MHSFERKGKAPMRRATRDPRLPSSRRGSFHARLPLTLLLVLAAAVAACTGGGATSPSVPATGSGAIESPAAATAAPSNAASPSASQSPAAAFPLTLTDDEGTSVTIAEEPTKIASLTPAVTEILFELGLGDRIVGKAEDFTVYPPEAAAIPDIAKFDSVDVEQVVAKGTDLVIAGGNGFTPPDAITQLRGLDIPVLVVYAPDVETMFTDMELIGRAVGRADEATALADALRDGFADVGAATAGLDRPRVFYEIDATSAIYGPADRSFLAEMIELAGAEPITTGSETNFEIPLERLIEADPEIILLADGPFGVTAEQVTARPGWDVMTAVRDDEIRPIDDTQVTRPGPRILEGLRNLARAIHPDVTLP
jgi:iron complex transport system substrate-binding protein